MIFAAMKQEQKTFKKEHLARKHFWIIKEEQKLKIQYKYKTQEI